MKTKEEIVQLVNTFWFNYRHDNGYKLTGSLTHMSEKDMLVKLYTQCQEDNKSISKKLKLIEASINGSLDGIEFDNNSDVIEKSFVIDMLNDLKKLLNKQDHEK